MKETKFQEMIKSFK